MKVRRGKLGRVMSVHMSDDQPEELSISKQELRQMEQMERLIREVRSLRTLLILPSLIIILAAVVAFVN